MKKEFILFCIIALTLTVTSCAQTVYQKDKWGAKLYYMQENTIRMKDRWGTPLYYLDGQTLRLKDRWGAPVYYFDFIPDRWQIACLILM